MINKKLHYFKKPLSRGVMKWSTSRTHLLLTEACFFLVSYTPTHPWHQCLPHCPVGRRQPWGGCGGWPCGGQWCRTLPGDPPCAPALVTFKRWYNTIFIWISSRDMPGCTLKSSTAWLSSIAELYFQPNAYTLIHCAGFLCWIFFMWDLGFSIAEYLLYTL